MDANKGDGRRSQKNDTADADNGDGCHSEKKDTAAITEVGQVGKDHKGTDNMHDNPTLSDTADMKTTTTAGHGDDQDARSGTSNPRFGDNGLSITNLLNPDSPDPVNQNPRSPGDNGRHRTWIPKPGKDSPCHFCTKRPKGMLQRCSQCSTQICEACVVKGSLNNYPDHFVDPKELNWEMPPNPKKTKAGRPSKAATATAHGGGNDDGNWAESGPKTKVRFANQVASGNDEPVVRKRQRHSMSPPPDTTLTAASGRSAVRASAAMAVHKMSKPVRPYWDRANSPDEEEQDDDDGPSDQYHRIGSQPVPPPGILPQGNLQRPGSSQPGGPRPGASHPAEHLGNPPPNPYGRVGPQPGAPTGIPPPNIPNPATRPPRRQAPSRRASANSGPYNGPFSSRQRERQVTILYHDMFGGERYHPQALFITDLPRRIDEPAMMAQNPRHAPPPGSSVTGPPQQQQGQQGQQGYQQPLPAQGQQNYLGPLSAQGQQDYQRPRSAHGPQDYQRPLSAHGQGQRQGQGRGQHNYQRQLSEHDQHHQEVQTYMMTGGHFDPARQLPPQPPSYADTAFHNYPNQNQYVPSARPTPAYNPMNELHPEQIRLMHEDHALAVKISDAWINNPRVLRVRQLGLKAFAKINVMGRGSGPEDYEALKLLWEVALMRMGRVVLPTAPQTTKLFVEELHKIFFERRGGDGDGDDNEMDLDEEGGEMSEYDGGRDGNYDPRRG